MMMQYRLPDGRVLPVGAAFELTGIAYPGNWLELAGPEDLAARSIAAEMVADPAPSFDEARAAALVAIQAAADAATRRAVTSPEQAERYLSKAEDVTAWLTLQDAEAGARLQSEADARGITRDQLMIAIATKRTALKALSSRIEAVRAAGKTALEAATTREQVAAIETTTIAALEALT